MRIFVALKKILIIKTKRKFIFVSEKEKVLYFVFCSIMERSEKTNEE